MDHNLNQLIEQLRDEDNNVRSNAALTLGKTGDLQAIGPLIEVLCTDHDLNVVEDVTWALGRMKDVAIQPLIAALEHEDALVRHRIVHALGKFGDKQAVDALILRLQDTDLAVRYKAIVALGQIGEARSIGAIIGRLNDEDQLENRQCATDVLEQFGNVAVMPLIDGLSTVDTDTRELIIGILGEIGDRRAVEPLTAHLQDESSEVRIAVVTALGQIGDIQAIHPLQDALKDEDKRVQLVAKAALKMIGITTET